MRLKRERCSVKRISYFAVLCIVLTSGLSSSGAEEKAFEARSVKDKSKLTGELLALFQQNGDAASDDDSAVGEWHIRKFRGVVDCRRCHKDVASDDDPLGSVVDGWIHYGEYPIWITKDKHKQAFAVLSNARSQQMGKLLNTDVTKDERCLACHSGLPIALLQSDDTGHISDATKNLTGVSLGVTCEGCHGGASGRDSYHAPHSEPPSPDGTITGKEWRFLSPKEKQAKGFNDVRSPVARARICASCHVGEVAMGRVVTHEMYAAGHPPLPGFEVETFVDQMPRHWRHIAEKNDKVVEKFVANTRDELYKSDHFDIKSLIRTRSMLASSLVVLSQNIKLLADLSAGGDAGGLKVRPEWPEIAQFECFACHHDLSYPGWRQSRKPVGVPGRPPIREWPMAIPRVAVKVAGLDEAAFNAALNDVLKAAVARPFGNADAIQAAAKKFTAWADDAAEQIQRKIVSRDQGKAILSAICNTCTSETMDYDSARQLVWAFTIVEREMNGKLLRDLNLNEALGDPINVGNPLRDYDPDSGLLKALTKLDYDPTAEGETGLLMLNLRKGKKENRDLPININLKTTEVDLMKSMPPVGSYDPAKFKAAFSEVSKLVEKM